MAALTAFLQDWFDILVERYRCRSLESKHAGKGNQTYSFRDVHHSNYSRPPNKPKVASDRRITERLRRSLALNFASLSTMLPLGLDYQFW